MPLTRSWDTDITMSLPSPVNTWIDRLFEPDAVALLVQVVDYADPGVKLQRWHHHLIDFDPDRFLRTVEGDRTLLRKLIGLMLGQLPELQAELVRATAAQDAAALARSAHKLKGSVGNLGAGRAVQAAQRLESLANDSKLHEARAALAALIEELRGLRAALTAYLQSEDRTAELSRP